MWLTCLCHHTKLSCWGDELLSEKRWTCFCAAHHKICFSVVLCNPAMKWQWSNVWEHVLHYIRVQEVLSFLEFCDSCGLCGVSPSIWNSHLTLCMVSSCELCNEWQCIQDVLHPCVPISSTTVITNKWVYAAATDNVFVRRHVKPQELP